jgi:hypothetical protein
VNKIFVFCVERQLFIGILFNFNSCGVHFNYAGFAAGRHGEPDEDAKCVRDTLIERPSAVTVEF